MSEPLDFRPWSDEHKADPYPLYAQLRAEAPVRYPEKLGVWTVARPRDVEHALDDPDGFDLARVNGENAAFGFGVHYCMGAGLARLEARVGLEELLRHMPEFTVVGDSLRWRTLIPTRGPVELPVTTTRRLTD